VDGRLTALYDLGRQLILLRDARQIAEAVLDIAARILDFQDSDFLLVDEAQEALYLAARRGLLQDGEAPHLPLDGERGITVAAARARRPVYVADVRQDDRYVYTGFSARSELAVPVQTEGRVLGVLNVESAEPDAFDAGDQEMLAILASQAALALENARLHREERRRAEEMLVLNELARRIGASLDLQATLDAVVAAAFELIPCVLAEVSLWDENSGLLTLQAARAAGASTLIAVDVVSYRLEHALRLGATHVVNDSDGRALESVRAITSAMQGFEPRYSGVDVAFETAGAAATTRNALAATRPGGVTVLVGLPPEPTIELDIVAAASKAIDIRGLFRYANRYPVGISLTAAGRIDVTSLVTHHFPLREAGDALRFADEHKGDSLKVVIDVGEYA